MDSSNNSQYSQNSACDYSAGFFRYMDSSGATPLGQRPGTSNNWRDSRERETSNGNYSEVRQSSANTLTTGASLAGHATSFSFNQQVQVLIPGKGWTGGVVISSLHYIDHLSGNGYLVKFRDTSGRTIEDRFLENQIRPISSDGHYM